MEPQLKVRLTGNRQKALETFKRYFPSHSPQDVAAAAGFLPGSTVFFSHQNGFNGGPPLLNLDDAGTHPQLNLSRDFYHVLDRTGDPKLVMHAHSQEASASIKGKGYERFKSVVEGLRRIGVHQIKVGYAPRGKATPLRPEGEAEAEPPTVGGYNGYYTWPRFAFQGQIREPYFRRLPDEVKSKMGDKRDFHSLFEVEGGAEAWKEFGGDADNLHFDLHPESEHSKRFATYYEKRRQKEQAAQPQTEGRVRPTDAAGQSTGGAGAAGSGGSPSQTPPAGEGSVLYRLNELLLRYAGNKSHRRSCLYVPVKGELRERVLSLAAKVPADLLADDGRATDPHVTLFYGLHTEDPDEVAAKVACLRSPLQYKLCGLAVFEKGDYDVLYLQVTSPALVILNHKLRSLPYTTDYPRYLPHCTVACVKAGEGWRLAKSLEPVNAIGQCAEAVFSDADGKKTKFSLMMGDRPAKYAKRKSKNAGLYNFYTEASGDDRLPIRAVIVRRRKGQGFPLFSSLHPTEAAANKSAAETVERLHRLLAEMPSKQAATPAEEPVQFAMKPKKGEYVKTTYVERPESGFASLHFWTPAVFSGELQWFHTGSTHLPLHTLRDHYPDAVPHSEFMPDSPAGTTKVGPELTPAEEQQWIRTKLGLTGANEASVDWRPTEMLPEDFYAMKTSDEAVKYDDTDVTRETKVAPLRPNQQPPKRKSINDLIAQARQRAGGNRVDEDLRLFKKSYRSNAVFSGPQPNSVDERAALADHAINRGLKVVQSAVTSYDESTHTLFHPTPEDKAAVGEAYTKWGTGATKFRFDEQPVRYAGEELKSHPMVAGYRLEHALRHLATDPTFTESGRLMAKRVLVDGHTDALYGLNDELQEYNHPLATQYNWVKAASALHLDAAVGHAIDSVTGRVMAGPYRRSVAMDALHGANANSMPSPEQQLPHHRAAAEVISLLRQQGHSQEDIQKSIGRHSHRRATQRGIELGVVTPEEVAAAALDPTPEGDPTRYRQSPALSEFIAAVRQVRSSNQEVRRQLAESQYQKMKLEVQAVKDAIADFPHTASANTAAHILHDGDLDRVRAAASLYGLATNSPSLLIFHSNETGNDWLHHFEVAGSAEKLRRKLDDAGLVNRTLMPTETGWGVVLFDPNGLAKDQVKSFASSVGSTIQSSRGFGEVIGDSQDAEGDKSTRRTYRSLIKKWERSQNAGLQQRAAAVGRPNNDQHASAATAANQSTAAYPTAGAAATGTAAAPVAAV